MLLLQYNYCLYKYFCVNGHETHNVVLLNSFTEHRVYPNVFLLYRIFHSRKYISFMEKSCS